MDGLRAWETEPREAGCVRSCPAVGSAPSARDRKDGPVPPGNNVETADAGGVKGVGFRHVEAGAVPLRPTAGAGLDRQTRGEESAPKRPASGVDGRRVAKRRF